MARPKKETVEYFPHYTTSGKTLYILESDFGNDGYAFWFKLLELLGSSDGHVYDCNNAPSWKFLLAKTRVDEEVAVKILDTLAELGAIDKKLWEHKLIWSDNFVQNLAPVYSNRRTLLPEKPIVTCSNNNTDELLHVETQDSEVSTKKTPQSKVKESKVKESRVYIDKSDSANPTPPIEPKIDDTNTEKTKTPQENIFDHWNSKGIIVHRKATDRIKSAINAALKDYKEPEILTAIDNYAIILADNKKYYWTYKWGLREFLQRGIDKFLDFDVAAKNYIRDDKARGDPPAKPKNKFINFEQREHNFDEIERLAREKAFNVLKNNKSG